jgi:asparagine synthase (glutamine-hydrolysing)
MCGICGIVTDESLNVFPEQLEAMNALASHRGPDDEGMVFFGRQGVISTTRLNHHRAELDASGPWSAGLGHRRLSILDLSPSGHQPMSDPSGRYWIVLNGEIYNYVELRDELESLGHHFCSRTDTEVALTAYIAWGPEMLSRCNGMWGLAIYDRAEERLFCARDRLGVKPFYYIQRPRVFAFASEIKQLLPLGLHSGTVNQELLADLLLWGFDTHKDDTFFKGIKALPPGCYLIAERASLDNGNITPVRYWSPAAVSRLGEQEAIERFRELLTDAVRLRLRSDVPVGVTLSGGLDSSSLMCLAARLRQQSSLRDPIRAFTVSYPDRGYSEKSFAEQVVESCNAQADYLTPEGSTLEQDWQKFVWHMEEPFSGLSYYSNYKIYQLIRAHGVPVILTGQGGDEILLGYDRYRVVNNLVLLRQWRFLDLLREVNTTRVHASLSYRQQLFYLLYFGIPGIRARRRRFMVRPFLSESFYRLFGDRTRLLEREARCLDLHDLQVSEVERFQLPHLLHHEDRVSMASGIEARTPFLDYRLFEFILGQGPEMLIRGGWSKVILREAMRGILPEGVRLRTDKMGFETPTGRLLHDNRAFFMDLLQRHLSDPFVRTDAVARSFEAGHIEERLLSSILSYLTWKEQFSIGN